MSRGGQVQEDRIEKGGTGTLVLTCQAPLIPGEHSETFAIISPDGTEVSDALVTVTVIVNDTGQKVLEVTDTGTGYLNVRDGASGYSNIIDTVAVGEKYLYEEYSNGYYKIVNGESSGWVVARYVNVLTD